MRPYMIMGAYREVCARLFAIFRSSVEPEVMIDQPEESSTWMRAGIDLEPARTNWNS